MGGRRVAERRSRAVRWAAGLALLAAVAAGGAWWWAGRRGGGALAESARAAVLQRRHDEALRLIDAWAARRPGDGEPYYWKARALLAMDQAQPTFDALTRSLNLGYDPGPLEAIRGVMLARAGRYQEAEPLLRRAFTRGIGPEAEIAEGLARSYLSTFQLSKAAAVLDHWMKIAPDDARPYLWRNEINERSGADDSVIIRNYRLALDRDPDLDEARLKLADTLRAGQRNAEAHEEYERYLRRNPRSVPALVGSGQTALQDGDLDGAIRRFEEALAIEPREPVALRELALIDLRRGRFDVARDRLRTVVEVDAYDPEVRASYARALKMCGDEAASAEQTAIVERLRRDHRRIAELREALVENPDDLELKAEAARWLLEHGHDEEALEWTALILRERPGHAPTCRMLAEYHAKKGNVGLANYYRTAAGIGPAD